MPGTFALRTLSRSSLLRLSTSTPRSLRRCRGVAGQTCFYYPQQVTCCASASTLHKGVRPESESHSTSTSSSSGPAAGMDSPYRNLGETFAVKRDAAAARENRDAAGSATKREGRSFEDMMRIVDSITAARPQPCPNNMEVTQRLIDRLDMHPVLKKVRFVHVAGTKGKGTTSAYTAALLKAYGFKVALFTSPHLTDIRERILIDGEKLPKDTFARYFFELYDRFQALQYSDSLLDREVASRANFFRIMFLVCLHAIEAENVDVAVIEVGLGGRLDSTNIIPSEVSIITALGYDHMEILGNTLEAIALEKAGIMKTGVVCFASPQPDHPQICKVLEKHAREVDTPLLILSKEIYPLRSWPRLAIGGDHAIENSKIALMAARHMAGIPPASPLDEVEKTVLSTMTYAGRSQVVPIEGGKDMTLYLDGAHTPESLQHATKWFLDASAAQTGDATPRRVLLFYSSRDPQHVLKAFMPDVSSFCKVILAQIDPPKMTAKSADKSDSDARAAQMREAMTAMTQSWRTLYREVPCLPCARPFEDFQNILDLIVPAASDQEDASKPAQVFVCGSFFLLADILNLVSAYEAEKAPQKMPRA